MMRLNKGCKVDFRDCIRCILKNIGATIMGVKPAELRNIRFNNSKIWDRCKSTILAYDQIKMIELNEKVNRKQVLFYHEAALDQQLRKAEVLEFLKKHGYPQKYNLKSYLDFLVKRLRSNEFPHEIGIFFGYPLKDVLGFMGYSDLKVTHSKEWKIYGDKSISLLQQKRFEMARDYFNKRIDRAEEIEQLYNVV